MSVGNIYDLNAREYLIKLNRGGNKLSLVIDSGINVCINN